jgi:hypothetical protein
MDRENEARLTALAQEPVGPVVPRARRIITKKRMNRRKPPSQTPEASPTVLILLESIAGEIIMHLYSALF